jgi:hypothetical protein
VRPSLDAPPGTADVCEQCWASPWPAGIGCMRCGACGPIGSVATPFVLRPPAPLFGQPPQSLPCTLLPPQPRGERAADSHGCSSLQKLTDMAGVCCGSNKSPMRGCMHGGPAAGPIPAQLPAPCWGACMRWRAFARIWVDGTCTQSQHWSSLSGAGLEFNGKQAGNCSAPWHQLVPPIKLLLHAVNMHFRSWRRAWRASGRHGGSFPATRRLRWPPLDAWAPVPRARATLMMAAL